MNNDIDKLDNGDFKVKNPKTIGDYTVKNVYVSTKIGGQSLVGVSGEAPHSWGNYFSLREGSRVVNFWSENLEAANLQFGLNGHVKVRKYTSSLKISYVLIDDARIPADWYYNKLCFTGCYSPPIDVIKDMFDYLGDPDNEFEKYTDPESYYFKRGKKYTSTGYSYSISDIDQSLQAQTVVLPYKGKSTVGEAYMYAPYIPEANVTTIWSESALEKIEEILSKKIK